VQPASIFVFRAGLPVDTENRFDYFVPKTPPADLVAVRYNDVFVIAVFGDNGYWGRHLGGLRIVQEASATLVLHPVQCDELKLWFASEVGGAHTSSGCYDIFTTAHEDQAPRSVFISQFRVEPTGAPRALLNLMRANSLLKRLNVEIGEADLNAIAAAERPPTTLANGTSQELVQVTCFERSCPEVFRLAGWTVSDAKCSQCGS
jgi:hypothetical protein